MRTIVAPEPFSSCKMLVPVSDVDREFMASFGLQCLRDQISKRSSWMSADYPYFVRDGILAFRMIMEDFDGNKHEITINGFFFALGGLALLSSLPDDQRTIFLFVPSFQTAAQSTETVPA